MSNLSCDDFAEVILKKGKAAGLERCSGKNEDHELGVCVFR